MKREYITRSRRKCARCGERLDYNTCWPQNIPHDRVGWGYFYCADNTCREHMTPKDLNDLRMDARRLSVPSANH